MLNNNIETERNVITNDASQKEGENTMFENKEVREDAKENNIIKFVHINPEFQKHTLTLSTNDVITLYVDNECIKLISEYSSFNCGGKSFEDFRIARKTKKGYFFCLRVIYKDALQMLKKLGYKKQTEHIRINNYVDSDRSYYISEKWINEKHNAVLDCLVSISNISN